MTSSASSSSAPQPLLPDSLHISQLSVRIPLGVDSWERLTPHQPVTLDIQVHTDVSKAGRSDHLPYSIHYGILVKEVEKHCEEAGREGGRRYRSLEGLADGIAKVCLFVCKAPKVTLKVQKPRSLLHARSAGVEIFRVAEDFEHSDGTPAKHGEDVADLHTLSLAPDSVSAIEDKVVVKDLLITTILGVNPWERVDKQVVKVNLTVFSGLERSHKVPSTVDTVTSPQNYRTIVRAITEHIESTNYKTVESLALSIARVAVVRNRVPKIRVRVDKPSAIMFADAAGCEVERDWRFFENEDLGRGEALPAASGFAKPTTAPLPTVAATTRPSSPTSTSEWHVAAIALGSNLGDRALNIERAVQALSSSPDCKLIDTSFLYDTSPMYYTDQPSFLNGACRIATRLSPERLLDLTQSIEVQLGRDKRGVPIKGPRRVDLDIVFYDRLEMSTERLTIPHPGVKEREFVLRPLADILPQYAHPTSRRSVQQLLNLLVNSEEYEPADVKRVMPLGRNRASAASASVGEQDGSASAAAFWTWGERTYLMGIINATPDSFSDGGDNLYVEAAIKTATSMVSQGVDILDVGGMSTAPNAVEVDEKEETARVVPVIKAIRAAGISTPISIDTFRAGVAQAALDAGADVINDVTGGERDVRILDVAREAGVPYILMHTRGDSKTMGRLASYPGGVVEGVCSELATRVQRALRRGVRRWNLVLDPGVGFAKDAEGNLDLIRGLARMTGGGGGAGLGGGAGAGAGAGMRGAIPGLITPEPATSRVVSPKVSTIDLPTSSNGAIAVKVNGSSSEVVPSSDFNDEDDEDPSHLPSSSLHAFPLLLGPSRKRFIGSLTGKEEPKDRVFGTAAACVAAVAGGVDILRVHDVPEMRDVVSMADAIYRRRGGGGEKKVKEGVE
ncbi:Dihydropteroate synthase [Microstroma glucosiphilum]|uniref:Dihydropteroate synthase n=1 Tax=Pseudomicrostroma glucosiphilum TaxID=1684307 RepID=A0A316TXB4_9BASI|nr:Dihydropteroate synthase [Pseudomicrostroma glucosiphilum]PWN18059.1 Dihydropteroate synthase [Pseudomicrostroma glucosiphilum]